MRNPLAAFCLFLATANASAATIPYQGLATDAKGNPLADAGYAVSFKLHAGPNTADSLWGETQVVATHRGLFSATLGSVAGIPSGLFSNSTVYLGVTFPGGSELTPRLALAVVPWASRAGQADSARASHRADSATYAAGVLDSVAGLRSTIASLNSAISGQATTISTLKSSIASLSALLSPSLPWNPAIAYGTLTDSRDGQIYRSVRIGTQIWMAQNLAYAGTGSMCESQNSDTCVKYGLVYNWATAMGAAGTFNSALLSPSGQTKGICPVGWHLPTNAEWTILRDTLTKLVGSGLEGKALKDSLGWVYGAAHMGGGDVVGFRALPAQQYSIDGSGSVFDYGTGMTYFWTATEQDAQNAAQVFLNPGNALNFGSFPAAGTNTPKTFRNPVRCVGN